MSQTGLEQRRPKEKKNPRVQNDNIFPCSGGICPTHKCAQNVYTVIHWFLLVVSLGMSTSLFILWGVYILPEVKTNQEAVADIQVRVQTLMNTVARIDEKSLLQPNVSHKHHHDGGTNLEEVVQSINSTLTELKETITHLQLQTNQEAVADIQVKVQTLMNTVARIDEQLCLQANVSHEHQHDGETNLGELEQTT